MNQLLTIVVTMLLTVSITGIIVALSKGKKGSKEEMWQSIRIFISEALIEAVKLYKANEMGYNGVETYCIDYIKSKIDSADFLLKEEKELITRELIKSLLEPHLKKLWEEKMFLAL